MRTKPAWGYVFGSILCGMVFSSSALAQLIDTKDVTSVSGSTAPPTRLPLASVNANKLSDKDCFINHSHGFVVREFPEKLRLEIASADLRLVNDTTEITANVRLRNQGDHAVLVPWHVDAVEPARTGGPNDEVSYEAASIKLKLGTQKYRDHGAFLDGEVELQAVPSDYGQHVELLPGTWVEVKFRTLVKCQYNLADPPLCSPFKADERARLTAQWSEWLVKERGEACAAEAASSVDRSRLIDSDPIEIEYVQTEDPAAANPPSSLE